MSKPTPPAEYDRYKDREAFIERARRSMEVMSPAARIDWVMKLLYPSDRMVCQGCKGAGYVETQREPMISRDQALELLELPSVAPAKGHK